MRGGRSKAPLALMEQLIMVLVFAIAAAICLQAFVYSYNLSKKGENTDFAINKSSEVAEYAKLDCGDWDKLAKDVSGETLSDGVKVTYKKRGLTLVLRQNYKDTFLQKAHIVVSDKDGEEVYSTEVAWQKGGTAG